MALLENDQLLADKLYSDIEKESTEAKSYLARKAFTEKNWKRAQELTESLLKLYPNNELLRDNYKKIMEEQQKQKTVNN